MHQKNGLPLGNPFSGIKRADFDERLQEIMLDKHAAVCYTIQAFEGAQRNIAE